MIVASGARDDKPPQTPTTAPAWPIRPADSSTDVSTAAELITIAFEDLLANAYLVPDPVRRFRVMRDWFRLLAGDAADGAGQLTIAGNFDAVGVWFDRTGKVTQLPHDTSRLEDLAGEFLPNFLQLDTMLDDAHPLAPHWHLAFLAVHPWQQGRGLGSALLDHAHRALDEQGHLAYLEATGPALRKNGRLPDPGGLDNRRLYERHGYDPLNDPKKIILSNGAEFHRMMRQPKKLPTDDRH
jgi:GNAT superfamily N-acetyltransferase